MSVVSWRHVLLKHRLAVQFDPAVQVENIITKFNSYLSDHGLDSVALNVSGGIDSAVTAMLLQRVRQLPNSNLKKVVLISQPIGSSAWAYDRAKELCETMGGEPLIVIDQTAIHSALVQTVSLATQYESNPIADGLLKSSMRTPVIYYITQLLRIQGYRAIVMGTGNADEDEYIGYFSKSGDGVVDVQLISKWHKSQVFAVGDYLGVPRSILDAPPSADLWENQTDENELKFPYDFVEFYTGYYLKLADEELVSFNVAHQEDEEFWRFKLLCDRIHAANRHKFAGVVNL